ncbi:MAG: DUF1071 domain-containing protein [Oscillospiraceae bacterium]|nr:DUF1071 domain-containing protein [Oscillospiraceae bacterium]
MAEVFDTLSAINVNDHTDKKGKFTYLSWPWAWAEVKKRYPAAHYEVRRDDGGLPFVRAPGIGYMVSTQVAIEGVTHEMWLPVMDGRNQAIQEPSMMDINKAIMRCLVKNLAMFGLGLYIYAGEDLPDVEDGQKPKQPAPRPSSVVFCADCKRDIKPVVKKDGTVWEVSDMAAYSNRRYGRALCGPCMKRAEQNLREVGADAAQYASQPLMEGAT